MSYEEKGLLIGKSKYGPELKMVSHLKDDTFELITMATPFMERVGDGLAFPVFCVNKKNGIEMFSDGILGLFENSAFDDLVPNKMSSV